MTREDALAFKARWQIVNDVISDEARLAPPAVKLRQLAVMFAAGQALGWAAGLRSGEEEVRARWQRLRGRLHA